MGAGLSAAEPEGKVMNSGSKGQGRGRGLDLRLAGQELKVLAG